LKTGNEEPARIIVESTDPTYTPNIRFLTNDTTHPDPWMIGKGAGIGELLFFHGSSTLTFVMALDYETNNVGIGTTAPASKLDIQGATNAIVLSRLNQIGDRNGCGLRLDRNTSEKWFIGLPNNGDGLIFRRTASSNDMILDETGDFWVAHDAYEPGGGSWADSSDERLKTNITEIDSSEALNRITKLRCVNFQWINPEEHSEGVKAGILAQDVEKVFPNWVREIEPRGRDKDLIPEGEKAGAISFPHEFNAYLIEAIKELKARNERLQVEIEELRSMINDLKSCHQQIAKR